MTSHLPVRGPEDIRSLPLLDLENLAQDIRQKIISTCLKNGGHLGASLGTVELTIALHVVFRSPEEPIVWDVGHQAYAHKIICGRWESFDSLRKTGGISGFLQREESVHDIFGAGHSSTALSAALAISWKKGRDHSGLWTVAVVGDGGMTAGLSFEALNNLKAHSLGPFMVVLNDNQMSISPNVGAVSTILSGDGRSSFFEQFGFEYHGPIDGHNLGSLIDVLGEIKETSPSKPILLHVITQKGRGYLPAEERPASYHGIGVGISAGISSVVTQPKTYSQILGESLCLLAEQDDRIVAITAAMSEGTGLVEFSRRFPDRFFDVGIAEPHAVTFAAGLATQGFKPVVVIYSTFLQRALDSIIHDVSLQKLGVTFAVDRAGVVGQDGPTHHGVFDLAYLGMIPGMTITAPACLEDLSFLLKQAVSSGVPWVIRYPRGSAPVNFMSDSVPDHAEQNLHEGTRWHRCVENPKIIVVGVGAATPRLMSAVQEADPDSKVISLLSTIQIKPISPYLLEVLSKVMSEQPQVRVVCLEDGVKRGGFGQSLAMAMSPLGRVETLGYADHFIPHGAISDLEKAEGVSTPLLAVRLKQILSEISNQKDSSPVSGLHSRQS